MSYPILAPKSTWFTQGGTTVTRASITTIDIKDSYTPTGTVTSQWDASAAKDGSITCYVEGTKLTIAGNGSGKIAANADSRYAFSSSTSDRFSNVTAINGADKLDTSNVTAMNLMFYRCKALTTLDVSNWNTSKVTTLSSMFRECSSLTTLDVSNWNVGEVTAMNSTFWASTSLMFLDLSKWNVSKVAAMNNAFGSNSNYGNMSLTSIGDVSDWNVSKVATMNGMFQNCTSLTTLDVSNWNAVACTDMGYMFNNCSSLQTLVVGNFNPAACTNMRSMFQRCASLQSLDFSTWNTSSCTDMSFMFCGCTSLTTLDVSNWNVSKVITMCSMFASGSDYGQIPHQLTELDVSKWNTESCTNMSFMFYGLNGLTKPLDVSKWNVSKVTTFDNMTAHSYMTINGVENWETPAAVNMNAMFHSIQNTHINVAKFDTSNVQFFSQMFQSANKLVSIKGLENFNTINGLGFEEMFQYCSSLKELNLSSFDTRKAKDGVLGSANGSYYTATMQNMFQNNYKLEKITLGSNFTFKGDGTTTDTSHYAALPTTPDGNWYTRFREPVATIPDYANETYYISLDIVNNLKYFIKNGTIMDITDAIREKTNITNTIEGVELANKILSIETKSDILRAENISF